MVMATFESAGRDLKGLVKNNKATGMRRVVLAGERIAKHEAPVKRGDLRRRITGRVEAGGDRGVIGSNAPHARMVHEGTGIYGPKKKRIVPTAKKALYWKGARHPVRSVKGQKPNRYMDRTRQKLQPVAERELAQWMNGVMVTIR